MRSPRLHAARNPLPFPDDRRSDARFEFASIHWNDCLRFTCNDVGSFAHC